MAKIPVFVRGTEENIYTAIENHEIKYPAYIWEKRSGEWWFLNENNTIEKGSSYKPVTPLTGNLEHPIVLSELEEDGLYAVKGIYIIAPFDYMTMYSTDTYVLFVVKTVDDEKRIKRIGADSIEDYVVTSEKASRNDYITEQDLVDSGYIDKTTFDSKIAEVEDELHAYVDLKIEEDIQRVPDGSIEDLFNND